MLAALLLAASAGCSTSHSGRTDGGVDATIPPGCGPDPVAECQTLCSSACDRAVACGVSRADCIEGCETAYLCPGETPDMDRAICDGQSASLPVDCPDLCTWLADFGGYGVGIACASSLDWTTFAILRGAGPCPGGVVCEWSWEATPDGSLAISEMGVARTAMLSTADLATFHALLDDPAFASAMRSGFRCDPPPTDVSTGFRWETAEGTLTQDVTGCVTTGPAGNLAERVDDLLTAY